MFVVVLDTNVIVSGLIRPGSSPSRVIVAFARGEIFVATSPPLIDELRGVVRRPRIMKYLRWSENRTDSYVEAFSSLARVVVPDRSIDACRDPDDNRVLEAAVAGQADAIVTGDRDLLSLGEFEGIPIISPARLLAMLELGP